MSEPSLNVTWLLESVRHPLPSADPFTIEEMRRSFTDNERRGKIRTLKKVYGAQRTVPFELAELATEDSDPAVRAWLASNGRDLDYRPWQEDHTRDKNRKNAISKAVSGKTPMSTFARVRCRMGIFAASRCEAMPLRS